MREKDTDTKESFIYAVVDDLQTYNRLDSDYKLREKNRAGSKHFHLVSGAPVLFLIYLMTFACRNSNVLMSQRVNEILDVRCD